MKRTFMIFMKKGQLKLDYSDQKSRVIYLMLIIGVLTALDLGMIGSSQVHAKLIIYPAKGQDEKQQKSDKYECNEWSKKETGIDPARLTTDITPEKVPQKGGVIPGAAKGAVLGVIGGAIGGDVGKGAAIGAGVGAGAGAMRRGQSQRKQTKAYEDAERQRKQSMQTFKRAYRTCLEARGYSVTE